MDRQDSNQSGGFEKEGCTSWAYVGDLQLGFWSSCLARQGRRSYEQVFLYINDLAGKILAFWNSEGSKIPKSGDIVYINP